MQTGLVVQMNAHINIYMSKSSLVTASLRLAISFGFQNKLIWIWTK